MEQNPPINSSKLCCVCLKHITDETQLMCEATEQSNIFSQLQSLVPEFLPSNVVLTNLIICLNCTPDVKSTVNFKNMCKHYGLSSESKDVIPSVGSLERGPNEVLIFIPTNNTDYESVHLQLSPAHNDLDQNVHGAYVIVMNQNQPSVVLHLQVTRNSSNNVPELVSICISEDIVIGPICDDCVNAVQLCNNFAKLSIVSLLRHQFILTVGTPSTTLNLEHPQNFSDDEEEDSAIMIVAEEHHSEDPPINLLNPQGDIIFLEIINQDPSDTWVPLLLVSNEIAENHPSIIIQSIPRLYITSILLSDSLTITEYSFANPTSESVIYIDSSTYNIINELSSTDSIQATPIAQTGPDGITVSGFIIWGNPNSILFSTPVVRSTNRNQQLQARQAPEIEE